MLAAGYYAIKSTLASREDFSLPSLQICTISAAAINIAAHCSTLQHITAHYSTHQPPIMLRRSRCARLDKEASSRVPRQPSMCLTSCLPLAVGEATCWPSNDAAWEAKSAMAR